MRNARGDHDDAASEPFADAAMIDALPQLPPQPVSPLAMRHPRRRRTVVVAAAAAAAVSSSPSSSSASSDDDDELAPTCLSRLEHAEAAAALSLPVGAWPHFRLLQRQLRERAEERRRRWRRRWQQQHEGAAAAAAAAASSSSAAPAPAPPPPPLLPPVPRTIPLGTLAAIHAQEAQHRASRLHPQHRAAMPALARRYWPAAAGAWGALPTLCPPHGATRPCADVIELATAADMPPCLLVRRLAEHLLRAPKGAVAEALRDASGAAMRRLADRAAAAGAAAGGAAGAAQSPPSSYHALSDALLRDAARAALADRAYSPAADAARALAGHEGEAALGAALRRAGVPFWTEGDLRARGLFKTPDAWLQAPAAVRVPRGWRGVRQRPRRRRRGEEEAQARKGGGGSGKSGSGGISNNDQQQQQQGDADGREYDQRGGGDANDDDDHQSDDDDHSDDDDDWRVVHWVDSKACFGDARAHASALEGQYRAYADRYGPGLVVYWAGHASGLEGATWPGWRDDLERDAREAAAVWAEDEGDGGGGGGGGGGGDDESGGDAGGRGSGGGGSAAPPPPPPWLVVVMDRFPRPEDVRLLPRVRQLPSVGPSGPVAAAADEALGGGGGLVGGGGDTHSANNGGADGGEARRAFWGGG